MGSAVSGDVLPVLVVGQPVDLAPLMPDGVICLPEHAATPEAAIQMLSGGAYQIALVNHTGEGEVTQRQLDALHQAQAAAPATKFILFVTHTTTRKVIEALQHGMFAYFSRPFDPLAVQEAIHQALALPTWSDGIVVTSALPEFITVRLRCRMYTADRLALFMKELPCDLSPEDRSQLTFAFREMLLNAIEHGGKFNPNQWVRVSRVRTKRTIVYHIEDPGEGFSRDQLKHAAIANPSDRPFAHMEVRAAEDMRAGGFGMLLTSRIVDEVIYSQKGNEVILIKHLD
jgi:anti-sigma regulatory factor (Ser/Thr protein kinase)/CheY-like chemotaxis protein